MCKVLGDIYGATVRWMTGLNGVTACASVQGHGWGANGDRALRGLKSLMGALGMIYGISTGAGTSSVRVERDYKG